MSKFVDVVKSEPVRAYVYTVAVAVLALLVALGVVTGGLVPVLLTVLSAVLVVGGVEKARASVTPTNDR